MYLNLVKYADPLYTSRVTGIVDPSASEQILKNIGKINWYQTTTNHNKTQTLCMYMLGAFISVS